MRKWHSKLRERMQRRGFRQEDVAEACGIDTSNFSKMLRGKLDTADDFETDGRSCAAPDGAGGGCGGEGAREGDGHLAGGGG